MSLNIDSITNIAISVILSSTSVFAILKLIGTRQIDHIYNISFEKFRNKINLEFDKTQRINQKEFDTLTELWNKAVIVKDVFLGICLNDLNVTIDLNVFSINDFDKFINDLNFPEFEKSILRNSKDRNTTYKNIISNGAFETLNRTYKEFENFVSSNRLFITDELFEKTSELKKSYHTYISIYLHIINDQNAKNALFSDVQNMTNEILKHISKMIQLRIKFEY